MNILEFASRKGKTTTTFLVPPAANTLRLEFGFLWPAAKVGLRFKVEQIQGKEVWLLGAVELDDVRTHNRDGSQRNPIIWTFREQLVRVDVCEREKFATTREVQMNGRTYRQLALCTTQRLEIETSDELSYSVDIATMDVAVRV